MITLIILGRLSTRTRHQLDKPDQLKQHGTFSIGQVSINQVDNVKNDSRLGSQHEMDGVSFPANLCFSRIFSDGKLYISFL